MALPSVDKMAATATSIVSPTHAHGKTEGRKGIDLLLYCVFLFIRKDLSRGPAETSPYISLIIHLELGHMSTRTSHKHVQISVDHFSVPWARHMTGA